MTTTESAVELSHLISTRWSPRSFNATHELRDEEINVLLEAARWAPSANNTQPWRFIVARRNDPAFAEIFNRLRPGNQAWAGNASALVVALAVTVDDDGNQRSHARYDLGQAVANMAIQATAMGLIVHQIGGFDAAAISQGFNLPDQLSPTVIIALGTHDPLVELPEHLAQRETAPRSRLPLSELVIS